MINRKIAILFVLKLFVVSVFSQSLSGRIVDEEGEALQFVSVILKNHDKKPIAFTHSDEGGIFNIVIPSDKQAEELTLNMMGYEVIDIPLKEFKNDQTYILYETTYSLKEVQVKGTKIRQAGDTLSYNVLAFKQKQDRTIADVIAKMPGLEVGADGKVLFEGKSINKYYIEGMDLLGGKYSLANENISADKVKKVEVLMNHQPIKAMNGIRFSDQAALNIVLREDAKNVWQGVADIGVGSTLQDSSHLLKDVRALEMLFSSKMQSISMLKMNNTGKHIEREISDMVSNSRNLSQERGFLHNIAINPPSLAAERYRFNDSYVVATNWLFRTSKNNDLRLQINGLFDKTESIWENERTYLDIDGVGAFLSEKNNAFCKRNEWKGEILYKVNSDKIYLSNSVKGYIDFGYSRGTSVINGLKVSQEVIPRTRYIANDLEYIRNQNGSKSFSVSSQVMYSFLPGRLLLYDGSMEQINLHTLKWNLYTYLRHKIASFNMTYRVGADSKNQHLGVVNKGVDSKEVYTEIVPYITPSVSYKDKNISFTASGKLGWIYRSLGSNKARHNIKVEPSLYFKYDFTGNLSTTFTYSCLNVLNELELLSIHPVYTSYITMSQGNGNLDNVSLHTLRNMWSYRDAIRGFFLNAGFSTNCIHNVTLFASKYEDGFYKRIATDRHSDNTNYQVSGKIGKSIGWGKLSIAASGMYGWNEYQLLIDKRQTDFLMRTAQLGFDLSYHPIEMLSLEGKSSMNYSHQENKQSSLKSSSLRYFSHKLNIFIMPGNWQIEWSNELYHSNDKTVSTNFFSDVSISYCNKSFEITSICTNIFGTSEYERRYVTNYIQSFTINQLRKRSFMIKFNFNF